MNWKATFPSRVATAPKIPLRNNLQPVQGLNVAAGPLARHLRLGLRLFFGAALLFALCFFVVPVGRAASPAGPQAQSEDSSATLASIQVIGSKHFASAQIAPATGLHVGSQINRADLQQAANALAQLGPFNNVQYRFTTAPTGVVVQFQVADAPVVPVFFDNFPWFTDDQLDAALKQSTPLYDGSAPEHGTLLDSMANSLGLFLVAHGHPGNVSHVLTSRVFTDQKVQEFKLDDTGVDVASVNFSDPLAQSDHSIRTRLADLIGKPYSRSAVELFELEQVRPVYLAHAYDHIQFGPPKPQFSGSNPSRVTVVAPIEAGPAYEWGGVTWIGTTSIARADLNALVKLTPGQPANGMAVEATWRAVQDAFTNLGYLNVALTRTPHYDDTSKRVYYTVAIDSGPQYKMGQLVLSGLSIEGERRIRGAWEIQPGQIFDKGTYEEFLAHGINKAFAGFPAHYDKIGRYLQKNQNDTVDVMMDFE
ncbi:MAG: POTRA domain-containing protein [Candidatus Acidiferrales bacterium]